MTVYPWQQTQWQTMERAYQQNSFPHALLFQGNEGLGITEFAQGLAMALLCDNFNLADPALETSRDWQLLQAASHPDFALLEPEEEGKQIKVEAIREMMEFLQLTSQYGRSKIVIITPAENMNRNAANALLKTLEEPPAGSILILVSHDPNRIPVTIRSRCQKLNFSSTDKQQALQWLTTQVDDPKQAESALAITGTPLAALAFLEQDLSTWRQQISQQLISAYRRQQEPIELAEQWKNEDSTLLLTTLQSFFHDLLKLRVSANDNHVINQDVISNLRGLSKQLDLFLIVDCCQQLMALKQRQTSTVSYNQQNLLEEFLLFWQQCGLKSS